MPADVTFVGTATTLLRLGSFTLLTDPNFLRKGDLAYLGYGLWTRRRTEPVLDIEDLPALDAVVLSHLHGDHFDRIAKARLPRETPIVTTQSAAQRLGRLRFREAVGLPRWANLEFRKGSELLRVTSVPGQHGPAGVHRLVPELMGSVIDLYDTGERRLRLYVTGDTLYRRWLRRIPERFPDIDAMLVHLGGTRVLGVLLTMDGRQGADMVELVRPRLTLPIHYDDYTAFKSPLSDFTSEVHDRDIDHRVRPIHHGQIVELPLRASTRGAGTI